MAVVVVIDGEAMNPQANTLNNGFLMLRKSTTKYTETASSR